MPWGVLDGFGLQKERTFFVDAMIALLPKYPDWTAIVTGRTTAGYQAFEAELRTRIAAAGLQDRILILGGKCRTCASEHRRLTLYVAPSRNEGFGLTPLEAMASKTAVALPVMPGLMRKWSLRIRAALCQPVTGAH